MRFDLSDEEWAVIEPHLPLKKRGPERVDDRRVLRDILYPARGAPWRDLPECYGPRTTVYNRYARWARRGIWRGVFEALAKANEDSLLFIDASIIMAHHAATGAKGENWRRISAANAQAAQAKFTL